VPGSSNILSIWLNKLFEGPWLCLKWVVMLSLEKWLRHKMFWRCSCWAITRVKIDLLYGKNSVRVATFLLFTFCCFNFFKISKSVLTLLSPSLARGRLTNVNVLIVLKEYLFTSLNYITNKSSFSSVSL